MNDEQRRRELRDFLRTRRARLSPEEMGFPVGRRRTPGLRREEVAQLASVSTTWYSWLEQGQDIRVSAQVLESLVRALKLTAEERNHLFMLALGQSPPDLTEQRESISPVHQRVLDHFEAGPAYITGRRWDILAWNQVASLLFGDFSVLLQRERNFVWFFFTNEAHRHMLVDWEDHAQFVLSKFRSTCSRYLGDERLIELIEDLQRVSPEFRDWWSRHDVFGRPFGRKEYEHSLVGRLVFEYTAFLVAEATDLRFVVYTPLPESDTLEKLQQLKELHIKVIFTKTSSE
ncbi:helix-turn-helix transcriptional regulator [Leptolyngbya sp. FACHB-261]|uniref:helix-turn-helix transcriptional regulator n=1 Tax=Leptolyngbya sp. FACHB-261 TaxID=2692806 RepID=UPI0018EFB99C|nr:helix-turn-helix transcriptional regulator [Leptolyngbya sp. FACHB-261]